MRQRNMWRQITTRPKFDPRRFAQYRTDLALAVYDLSLECKLISAIDRIKAKALQARSIVPTLIKAFESDLDSLLAEGPKLHAEKQAAIAQHMDGVAGLKGEFAGLKSAIDILSNGEETPDPLPVSAPAVSGSLAKPQYIELIPHAPKEAANG